MIVASLIDADEKTIPDLVTIPGTLIGLALITALPAAMPPQEVVLCAVAAAAHSGIEPLTLAAPNDWPHDAAALKHQFARHRARSATASRGALLLLPAVWRTRRGLARAWCNLHCPRLMREPFGQTLSPAIATAGHNRRSPRSGSLPAQSDHWHGLLSVACRPGCRRRHRLGGARCRPFRPPQRGDGVWRCHIDGNDRQLIRAGSPACSFFSRPICGAASRCCSMALPPRARIARWPVSLSRYSLCPAYWAALWELGRAAFRRIGWLVPAAVTACMALMLWAANSNPLPPRRMIPRKLAYSLPPTLCCLSSIPSPIRKRTPI